MITCVLQYCAIKSLFCVLKIYVMLQVSLKIKLLYHLNYVNVFENECFGTVMVHKMTVAQFRSHSKQSYIAYRMIVAITLCRAVLRSDFVRTQCSGCGTVSIKLFAVRLFFGLAGILLKFRKQSI